MGDLKGLFVINGQGLGNSTRCHALIQPLKKLGVSSLVASFDNGLWYFQSAPEVDDVIELKPLLYGGKHGRVSFSATLRLAPRLVKATLENRRIVKQAIRERGIDFVISDSMFFLGNLSVPRFFLNNSDEVIRNFLSSSIRKEHLPHFLIELMDYLYHRTRRRWIRAHVGPQGKKQRVSLFCREQFSPQPQAQTPKKVIAMPSGSRFGFQASLEGVEILRENRSSWRSLSRADIVVTNAGFSSLSECLAMRKPMVIVPVKGHAEQWVNAQRMKRLGVAEVASEGTLSETLKTAVQNYQRLCDSYEQIEVDLSAPQMAASRVKRSVLGDESFETWPI